MRPTWTGAGVIPSSPTRSSHGSSRPEGQAARRSTAAPVTPHVHRSQCRMRLPPGVSESDFRKALAEFEQVVGADWVFTSDADVDLYRDAYSPFAGEPEELVASSAVAPASTEQVQQIVRIANRYR